MEGRQEGREKERDRGGEIGGEGEKKKEREMKNLQGLKDLKVSHISPKSNRFQ